VSSETTTLVPAGSDADFGDSVVLHLTDEEARQIAKPAADLIPALPAGSLDQPELITAAEVFAGGLPARIAAALSDFRRHGNDYGTLLLRNVPLDEPPTPTPADGVAPPWTTVPMSTVVQLAVTSWMGDLIAYADEKDGLLVQDVIPAPGAEDRQENTGSKLLELHTEDGFHPYKPDYLTLLCLRGDRAGQARTVTGSVDRALPLLSDACVRALRRPRFVIEYASSFTPSGAAPGRSKPLAVLSGPLHRPELVADLHAMRPLDPAAGFALDELRTALTGCLRGVVLEPGDLLIVDNRTAVHGRTAFRPLYDGSDRWLRRCFAMADLRRSRAARRAGSQVCVPLHLMHQAD
jgi:L-asparagine oxygenase